MLPTLSVHVAITVTVTAYFFIIDGFRTALRLYSIKEKNNRSLKTYFPGTFISAVTDTGFNLTGTIRQIKNDSVFIEQQEVRQVPTQFGVPALDTIVHTIRLHYTEIRMFYYSNNKSGSGSGRKRSYGGGLIRNIMIVGGTGFIVLELVNTIYRGESLSDGNKLTVLAIAAGVAATGILWKQLENRSNSAGSKYKVVYVNMSIKKSF